MGKVIILEQIRLADFTDNFLLNLVAANLFKHIEVSITNANRNK